MPTEQEIIDFTRAEFGKHSLDDQTKMYAVILWVACMKWPDRAESLKAAYRSKWIA